jgi:membrane-associated phospholipid phosphatase
MKCSCSAPCLFLFVLYFILLCPLHSQDDGLRTKPDSLSFTRLSGAYALSYLTDTRDILKLPLKWENGHWITAAALTGAAIGLYSYDREIMNAFQRNRFKAGDFTSKSILEPAGSGLVTLPALALLYGYGSVKNNDFARGLALSGTKACLLGSAAAIALKHLTHRHRPFLDDPPNPRLWEGPLQWHPDCDAFPSRHTSASFAIASFIASVYGDKKWVGVAAYTLAGLIGLSRINENEHWASDVFVGATIGVITGNQVYRSFYKSSKAAKLHL